MPPPATPLEIQGDQALGIATPTITVGSIASCGGLHEAVYVAWPSADVVRCNGTGGTSGITWQWSAYDTVSAVWWGPFFIETDSAYPRCIGSPDTVTAGSADTNNPIAEIASMGRQILVAHNRSSPLGTRIHVHEMSLTCSGGQMVPSLGPVSISPDPCYARNGCPGLDAGQGGNGIDGGIVTNDEWGASIAILPPKSPFPLSVLVTWYSTRGDLANDLVRVWGGTTQSVVGNPFNPVFTVANISNQGQTVPWDHALSLWWDYQAIGVDNIQHSFLAAWGGDARFGSPGAAGIWGARLQ